MPVPVITPSLARRLQNALFSLQISGAQALQYAPGNPLDMHVERFGQATAFAAYAVPGGGWWNRVVGFNEDCVPALDEILAFFRSSGLGFYLDMEPTALTEDLARTLIERKLYPAPYGSFLYGLPQCELQETLAEGIEIQETEDVDQYLDLWADGFEFPRDAPHTSTARLFFKYGPFSLPDNHLYIARVDGVPAAVAALYITDGIGHLHSAATLPHLRQRGCHMALLARTISDAAKAHCSLVTADTGQLGTSSQNHLERAGLRIAFTRIIWMSWPQTDE